MKVDYIKIYKDKLKENIKDVRKSLHLTDFIFKIKNHAIKYDRTYDDVYNKILEDDMYAEIFAKDPSKQNIYEKSAASYIKSLIYVENFENLPSNVDLFVNEGKIVNKSFNDVKSIDFTFNIGEYNFYCSHKYIKDLIGGAQDNQYNDIRKFLRNCNKINSGNDYFIAICDGNYFTINKIKEMEEEFGSDNVIITSIEYLDQFLLNFV